MNLTDLFTPAAIAANWTEVASNRIPYLGEGLFPGQKKAGLDLSWIKGSNGLPISLMPSAFDAQATFRDRIGVSRIDTEMPFFREGKRISEKDRQEILRVTDSADPYAQAVLSNLYNDSAELIEGAEVVAERMRMQLLFPANGDMVLAIKANGVDYTYDYDPAVNGTRKWKSTNYTALSGTALWTAPTTADPFADIDAAKKAVRQNTGSEIAYAVMNDYTFNLLAKTDAVKNRFITTNGTTVGYITERDVKNVVAGVNEVQIVVYDKMYRNESKVAGKFVPNGYVALIPNGAIGNTWRGTTPEEADGSYAGIDVAIVNNGVAVALVGEKHPVVIDTIVSEIVLPSYERMDEVALLKVA